MSEKYYTNLITAIGSEDLHIEAKRSDERGIGLYATDTLQAGETLWAERPLLGALVRAFDTSLCVCETCGRFLGSLQLQLKFGLGLVTIKEMAKVFNDADEKLIYELLFTPELPKVPGEASRLTDETPIAWQADGDTLLFCSRHCRDGFDNVHRPLWESEGGRKVREVAKNGDMEYLLLAAKVILGFSGAEAELREGVRRLCGGDVNYWECVDVPEDPQEAAKFVEACKETLEKGARAMADLLREADVETKKFGTSKGLNGLVGKLCRNAIMVTYPNPLTEYLLAVSQTDADLSALRAVVQGATTPAVLDDDSVEVDLGQGVVINSRTLSPDYRGWAVFPLLSCVNHSCRPNMEIEFSGDGATLVANVLESGSIAAGEELMVSYCDIEEDSAGERQKQLDPYGFICDCERCCKRARKA